MLLQVPMENVLKETSAAALQAKAEYHSAHKGFTEDAAPARQDSEA